MAKLSQLFPGKYLKADDVDPQKLVMIKSVTDAEKMADGSDVPVVYFEGEERGLTLNKTNGNMIMKISGGLDDTDLWGGLSIVLYKTQTTMGPKEVDCIRVRAPKPGTNADKMNQKWIENWKNKDFAEAVEASGGADDDIPF